jgi:hypothetical protein
VYCHVHGHKDPNFAGMSRFRARYSVARSEITLDIHEVGEETNAAYLELFQLFLAYSALDTFEQVTKKPGRTVIQDSECARLMRGRYLEDFTKPLALSLSGKSKKRHMQNAEKFLSGESEDLRVFIYALRNLFCHGALTAARLDLTNSKKKRQLVRALSEAVLLASEIQFQKYVDSWSIQQTGNSVRRYFEDN